MVVNEKNPSIGDSAERSGRGEVPQRRRMVCVIGGCWSVVPLMLPGLEGAGVGLGTFAKLVDFESTRKCSEILVSIRA